MTTSGTPETNPSATPVPPPRRAQEPPAVPDSPAEERWAGESPAELDFEEHTEAPGVRHRIEEPGPVPDDEPHETGSRMPGEGVPTRPDDPKPPSTKPRLVAPPEITPMEQPERRAAE